MKWRFVCPICGYAASLQEWKDAGAPPGAWAFSCVGRWKNTPVSDAFGPGPKVTGGPCNYAGGGLFRMNPVQIIGHAGVFGAVPTAVVVATQKPGPQLGLDLPATYVEVFDMALPAEGEGETDDPTANARAR